MENRTYIVLLGVPGAGKGTQARLLSEKLKLPQISTGEIFRYNLKNETELGLLAKRFMDQGNLVPDEVTVKMVEDRLQQQDAVMGAIMDGFPRNLVQAQAFDEMTAKYGGVATVPLIAISDDEAMERITGRRECRTCGAVYHVKFNPPKVENICDIDGGELYQRDDDKPETARNRLFVYYKQTAPLIGYYFAHSLLAELDGTQSIADVHQAMLSQLIERGHQDV
ncbi:adenylate kinase [Chloroflexi bacterium TSY]|nr:adenylate kinase [Chloroflexi bacterium TSY]